MDSTVQVLKALAEPTRLRIAALCRHGGDLTVSELVRILGQSQPRVSRHLRLLTEARVMIRIPEGSWVFYRLNREGGAAPIVDAAIETLSASDTTLVRDRERLELVKQDRARTASEYFGANAEMWREMRALHVDQEQVNKSLLRALPGGRYGSLLDIGTGTGEMLSLFAECIDLGEGIDTSHDMLTVARSELERLGIDHCRVRHGDLYSLPYESGTFDIIVIHQVLHFVDDVPGALAEAARVAKADGHVLIADFAPHDREDLRAQHQHRRLGFSDSEISDACTRVQLTAASVHHLAGDPLTVTVWHCRKKDQSAKEQAA